MNKKDSLVSFTEKIIHKRVELVKYRYGVTKGLIDKYKNGMNLFLIHDSKVKKIQMEIE